MSSRVVLRPSVVGIIWWVVGGVWASVGSVTFLLRNGASWEAALCLVAAFSCWWVVVHRIWDHGSLDLEITPTSIRSGDAVVARAEVVRVARYSDRMSRGVRVELADGRWLVVRGGIHRPGKVLSCLRQFGYPMEGGPTKR